MNSQHLFHPTKSSPKSDWAEFFEYWESVLIIKVKYLTAKRIVSTSSRTV